jgi:membrane-bound ClpP family serine protease
MSLLLSSVVTGTLALLGLLYFTDWSISKVVVASGFFVLLGDLTLALTMEKVAPTKIAVGPGERYFHTDRSSDKAIVLSGFDTSPNGQVSVRGETWRAVRAPGDDGILSKGMAVHVVERDGLTLVIATSDSAILVE